MSAADEAAMNKCLFLTHFYVGQLHQIAEDLWGLMARRGGAWIRVSEKWGVRSLLNAAMILRKGSLGPSASSGAEQLVVSNCLCRNLASALIYEEAARAAEVRCVCVCVCNHLPL